MLAPQLPRGKAILQFCTRVRNHDQISTSPPLGSLSNYHEPPERNVEVVPNGPLLLLSLPLGEHNDFSSGFVFFHAAVGFDDLVELEDLSDLHLKHPGGYLIDQLLKRSFHEIAGLAGVTR